MEKKGLFEKVIDSYHKDRYILGGASLLAFLFVGYLSFENSVTKVSIQELQENLTKKGMTSISIKEGHTYFSRTFHGSAEIYIDDLVVSQDTDTIDTILGPFYPKVFGKKYKGNPCGEN